ncbi:MAG: SAM-dependent methyltransferase [Candidatus Rokuibacteriota bacterium]|nr:MAG: SAM-dependent methyltransferase [Candidatus Rokubacteria bacterium]
MTAGYWEREGLESAILGALAGAGRDVDALTIDDLAPADHFHGGGKAATDRLARLAGIRPGMRVLDVGGGLGGPARTLAATCGAHVTVVDVTESFVRTGAALTARLGLADRVEHRVGDALELDVPAASFDLVWTQNSGMNIADKERLYRGFARALRPGGVLATQEPMAGPVQPVIFPVMWARDASSSFLRTPAAMRAVMEAAGFRVRAWDDVTAETAGPGTADAIPPYFAPRIIMGDALDPIVRAGHRNREEARIVSIQAILDRL